MTQIFEKGSIIFQQADLSNCMYEVVSGAVGIYVNYGKADEKQLTTLDAGKLFGEMGIIENLPRSATAVALEANTELSCISTSDFSQYFAAKPEKAVNIILQLSKRLRLLTNDYMDACAVISEMEKAAPAKNHSISLIKRIEKFLNDYANKQVSAFGNDLENSKEIWS